MRTIIFDTETTGLITNHSLSLDKQPRVMEFAALILDDAPEAIAEQEYEVVVDPGVKLDEEITRITGFKNSDFVGKQTFSDVARQIEVLFESCDRMVGHNLQFDIDMLTFEFQRLGVTPQWPKEKICTIEATEYLCGYRLNLTNLHMHLFGEGFSNAHRAMGDVKALARCYNELLKQELI